MKSFFSLLIIAVSALAIISFEVSSATAADLRNWNIAFHDDHNNRIGQGTFSYDLSTERFIEEDESGYFGFIVRTEIDSFSATVMGVNWESSRRNLWWREGNFRPGVQISGRSDIFIFEDRWFLGDGEESFLNLNFLFSSDTKGTGTWHQLFYPNGFNSPPLEGQGTWTATLVPEPLTLLGTLTAVGFGAFFKRKLGKG